MNIEEIRTAIIGKRLQTLYHGHVQIDWGEVVGVETCEGSGEYRISVSTEPFGHYLPAGDIETLCRDGIVEKRNEYNKHYRVVENV